jgi:hypothetical protein
MIDSLQAELGQYRNKGYLPKGFDKLAELQAKLRPDDPRKGAGGDGMGYGFRPT